MANPETLPQLQELRGRLGELAAKIDDARRHL